MGRKSKSNKYEDTFKVSIIMPSLNVVEYIDECIQSVINQTLKEIEIICIDAGSTDGTWEKLCSYADNKENIVPVRLIHSDVKSYGYQVNMGIKVAKGEYIAIVETDDYVSLDMYETLYAIAERTNADVVKADYDYFYTQADKRRIFQHIGLWEKDKSQYNHLINPSRMIYIYDTDYNIWKGIYNKEFLKKNDIWLNESQGAAYQDIGFVQQVLACAQKVYYLDRSLYRYRIDRDTSSTNSLHGLQYSYQEFKRLLEDKMLLKKLIYPAGLYRRMAQSFYNELTKLLKTTDYDIHSEHIEPYTKWFVQQIGQALDQGLVLPSDLDIFYQYFQTISADMEKFASNLKQQAVLLQNNTDEILSKTQDRKTIVFGAGIRGNRAIRLLLENGRKIASICDNNKELWGTQRYGFAVISPQESVEHFGECVYLIANKDYADEIEEQLCSMGILKESILRLL